MVVLDVALRRLLLLLLLKLVLVLVLRLRLRQPLRLTTLAAAHVY